MMSEFGKDKLRYMDFSVPRKWDSAKLTHLQKLYCANFNIAPSDFQGHLEQKKKEYAELVKSSDFVKAGNGVGGLHARLLHDEFADIYKNLEQGGYPDEFAVLMLNETLSKVYHRRFERGYTNTYVQSREEKPVDRAGHMALNATTLDIIYDYISRLPNVDINANFSDVYFGALEELAKEAIDRHKVDIKGVETFGKGKWLKFPFFGSDRKNSAGNVKRLVAVVQNTPWCTTTGASAALMVDDFYVFMDNENQARVAVTIDDEGIDEVRGIANDDAQEVEREYLDVAKSFLESCPDVQHSAEWLEDISRSMRIAEYTDAIKEKVFQDKDIEAMLYDLGRSPYKEHIGKSMYRDELFRAVQRIAPRIAKQLGVEEEQMRFGTLAPSDEDVRIIIGDLATSRPDKGQYASVERIFGNVNISTPDLKRMNALKEITGHAYFLCPIRELDSLQRLGSFASLGQTQLQSLPSLEHAGELYFGNRNIDINPNLVSGVVYCDDMGGEVKTFTPKGYINFMAKAKEKERSI